MSALRDLFKFTRAGFAIQGLVDALVNRKFNSSDGCQNPELPGSKSAALKKILEGK